MSQLTVDEAVEALTKAKSKIQEGWTQGEYARTANGDSCYGDDKSAVCWCAQGAIQHAVGSDTPTRYRLESLLNRAVHHVDPTVGVAISYNDHADRTQAEVEALFDKAIEIAPEKLAAL